MQVEWAGRPLASAAFTGISPLEQMSCVAAIDSGRTQAPRFSKLVFFRASCTEMAAHGAEFKSHTAMLDAAGQMLCDNHHALS